VQMAKMSYLTDLKEKTMLEYSHRKAVVGLFLFVGHTG
jgi:hypothetical protein